MNTHSETDPEQSVFRLPSALDGLGQGQMEAEKSLFIHLAGSWSYASKHVDEDDQRTQFTNSVGTQQGHGSSPALLLCAPSRVIDPH